MLRSKPVLTATSAALRRAPVAKAFMSSASKMPTSGMPTPAWPASRLTVPSSQTSRSDCGSPMTRTPIIRLAVHFDSASEISAPPQPHAEYPLDDEHHHAEQNQHGEVGHDKEENALHEPFLLVDQPQYGQRCMTMIGMSRSNFKEARAAWRP